MNKTKCNTVLLAAMILFVFFAPVVSHDHKLQPVKDHIISEIPSVNGSAIVIDADDTDNLYARYRDYTIIANVSDIDGDIDHVNVSCLSYGGALQWTVKYTNSTDSFTVIIGDSFIELGNCFSNKTITYINLTIIFMIEWEHPDLNNVIFQTSVYDGTFITIDIFPSPIDIISSVEIINSTISDSRGNPSVTDLNITGTVVYCYSGISPLSDECDIIISFSTGNVFDLTLESGVFFNASIPSMTTVGLNVYTISVVPEGSINPAMDQSDVTVKKTYISDRVLVTSIMASDNEVMQGDSVNVSFNIIREYDSSAITTGNVTLEGFEATFVDGSEWYITATKTKNTTVVFDMFVISGETYGITAINLNSQSDQVIWEFNETVSTTTTTTTTTNTTIQPNPFIGTNPDGSVFLTSDGVLLIVSSGGFVIILFLIMVVRQEE